MIEAMAAKRQPRSKVKSKPKKQAVTITVLQGTASTRAQQKHSYQVEQDSSSKWPDPTELHTPRQPRTAGIRKPITVDHLEKLSAELPFRQPTCSSSKRQQNIRLSAACHVTGAMAAVVQQQATKARGFSNPAATHQASAPAALEPPLGIPGPGLHPAHLYQLDPVAWPSYYGADITYSSSSDPMFQHNMVRVQTGPTAGWLQPTVTPNGIMDAFTVPAVGVVSAPLVETSAATQGMQQPSLINNQGMFHCQAGLLGPGIHTFKASTTGSHSVARDTAAVPGADGLISNSHQDLQGRSQPLLWSAGQSLTAPYSTPPVLQQQQLMLPPAALPAAYSAAAVSAETIPVHPAAQVAASEGLQGLLRHSAASKLGIAPGLPDAAQAVKHSSKVSNMHTWPSKGEMLTVADWAMGFFDAFPIPANGVRGFVTTHGGLRTVLHKLQQLRYLQLGKLHQTRTEAGAASYSRVMVISKLSETMSAEEFRQQVSAALTGDGPFILSLGQLASAKAVSAARPGPAVYNVVVSHAPDVTQGMLAYVQIMLVLALFMQQTVGAGGPVEPDWAAVGLAHVAPRSARVNLLAAAGSSASQDVATPQLTAFNTAAGAKVIPVCVDQNSRVLAAAGGRIRSPLIGHSMSPPGSILSASDGLRDSCSDLEPQLGPNSTGSISSSAAASSRLLGSKGQRGPAAVNRALPAGSAACNGVIPDANLHLVSQAGPAAGCAVPDTSAGVSGAVTAQTGLMQPTSDDGHIINQGDHLAAGSKLLLRGVPAVPDAGVSVPTVQQPLQMQPAAYQPPDVAQSLRMMQQPLLLQPAASNAAAETGTGAPAISIVNLEAQLAAYPQLQQLMMQLPSTSPAHLSAARAIAGRGLCNATGSATGSAAAVNTTGGLYATGWTADGCSALPSPTCGAAKHNIVPGAGLSNTAFQALLEKPSPVAHQHTLQHHVPQVNLPASEVACNTPSVVAHYEGFPTPVSGTMTAARGYTSYCTTAPCQIAAATLMLGGQTGASLDLQRQSAQDSGPVRLGHCPTGQLKASETVMLGVSGGTDCTAAAAPGKTPMELPVTMDAKATLQALDSTRQAISRSPTAAADASNTVAVTQLRHMQAGHLGGTSRSAEGRHIPAAHWVYGVQNAYKFSASGCSSSNSSGGDSRKVVSTGSQKDSLPSYATCKQCLRKLKKQGVLSLLDKQLLYGRNGTMYVKQTVILRVAEQLRQTDPAAFEQQLKTVREEPAITFEALMSQAENCPQQPAAVSDVTMFNVQVECPASSTQMVVDYMLQLGYTLWLLMGSGKPGEPDWAIAGLSCVKPCAPPVADGTCSSSNSTLLHEDLLKVLCC